MNLLSHLPLAQLEPETGVQTMALVILASLLVFVFRIDSQITR